jgi:hypothetical protein
VNDDNQEWFKAGYVRNKATGRWHAVVRIPGENKSIVSERSFETREEVLAVLKIFARHIGGQYRPIQ